MEEILRLSSDKNKAYGKSYHLIYDLPGLDIEDSEERKEDSQVGGDELVFGGTLSYREDSLKKRLCQV